MANLTERIKKLETARGNSADEITQILNLVIDMDGSVIQIFRRVIGVPGRKELTTEQELAEAGYRRERDGSLAKIQRACL